MKHDVVKIDGSFGEGGGQILRTSLGLSMVSGKPLEISKIRAGRRKPGLMRQHLACVRAAAEVCGADVAGAELGAQAISFAPGHVRGGRYRFAVGSAGSCLLVLQTVLPVLLLADEASELELEGGTHNPMAPPFPFIDEVFLPTLRKMGVQVEAELVRPGFYPVGGGVVRVRIDPVRQWRHLHLLERGDLLEREAVAMVVNLPGKIAQRELKVVGRRMNWPEEALKIRDLKQEFGAGNALWLRWEFEHACEMVVSFGERQVSAEQVARFAVRQAKAYLEHAAPVGEHLADQLLIPMALAGGGRFRCGYPSLHARTNMQTIQEFLPVRFEVSACEADVYEIRVERREYEV